MKTKIFKFSAIAIVMLAFSAVTFGQATSPARAVVITPISIAHTGADLVFGNIVATAAGGTVTVDAASARTASAPALITNTAVAPSAAAFTVTGLASATYAITLPANGTVLISNGTVTMAVDAFSSTPTTTGTIGGGGTQALTVGATLTVNPTQATGTYNTTNAGGSGDFTVTVNYN